MIISYIYKFRTRVCKSKVKIGKRNSVEESNNSVEEEYLSCKCSRKLMMAERSITGFEPVGESMHVRSRFETNCRRRDAVTHFQFVLKKLGGQ